MALDHHQLTPIVTAGATASATDERGLRALVSLVTALALLLIIAPSSASPAGGTVELARPQQQLAGVASAVFVDLPGEVVQQSATAREPQSAAAGRSSLGTPLLEPTNAAPVTTPATSATALSLRSVVLTALRSG